MNGFEGGKNMKKIKRRKRQPQQPSYGQRQSGSMPMYKPKVMTQEDMDDGLKRIFADAKGKSRQQEPYPRPRGRKPQPSMFGQPPRRREPVQEIERQIDEYEEDEEAYWSGEDWEEWALALYDTYPDLRPYLPEWFLEAVEE